MGTGCWQGRDSLSSDLESENVRNESKLDMTRKRAFI